MALPTGAFGSSLISTIGTVVSAALFSSCLISVLAKVVADFSTSVSAVVSFVFHSLEFETDGLSLMMDITGDAGNSVNPFDFAVLFVDFAVVDFCGFPIDGNFSTLDGLILLAEELGP